MSLILRIAGPFSFFPASEASFTRIDSESHPMEEEGGGERYSLEYFSAPRQRFKYVPAMKVVVRQKRERRRQKEEEEGQLGNVSLESNPWLGQSAKRETRTKVRQS